MQFIDLAAQQARIKKQIDANIEQVLSHGQYILGPEVAELEDKLKAYCGAKHCISVANGTDALQIALMALGVGAGDEVITPGFTYIATAETVALLGANRSTSISSNKPTTSTPPNSKPRLPRAPKLSCPYRSTASVPISMRLTPSPPATTCPSSKTRRRVSAHRTKAANQAA